MSKRYDLVVMGSGPAGSTAAVKAAEDGKRVAMIESREFGGTCALRGCNPKKVYVNAGQLVDQARRAKGTLLSKAEVALDWSQLLAFKREFTEPVLEGKQKSLADKGIETLHGHARFIDKTTLELDGETIEADRFFIATGARPIPLGIEGEEYLVHSDEFLELDSLPQRVLFIGGGYISMEFAHVAEANGCEVMIVERADRPLVGFDPDLVGQLVDFLGERKMKLITGSQVTSIEKQDQSYRVEYRSGDSTQSLEADLVVHGAGRVPNLEGLDLETGGIETSKKGIAVDHHLRSVSNPAVFSAGDCAATKDPRLTPAANEEARIAIKNILQEQSEHVLETKPIPAVAFTSPPIAQVGLSESDARDSGRDVRVSHEDTSTWGSTRKTGVRCSGYKVIVDRSSDQILGAHLLGPGAEETINLFALAIQHGLTATNLKAMPFAFPTFAHGVRRMV